MSVAGYIKYRYEPSQKIKDKLWDFAFNVYGTNKDVLEKRNQFSASRAQKQTYVGKLLEVATRYWALSKKYDIVQDVDIEIYNKEEKSFASDLVIGCKGVNKKISCKSSLDERGGELTAMDMSSLGVVEKQYSYLYQNDNNDGVGGHDGYKHDVYVFGNYYEKQDAVEVYAWVDAEYVKRMYVLPFMKKFWKNEKNFYGKVNEEHIKYCIMQKSTNIGDRLFPCSIDELISRLERQNKDA